MIAKKKHECKYSVFFMSPESANMDVYFICTEVKYHNNNVSYLNKKLSTSLLSESIRRRPQYTPCGLSWRAVHTDEKNLQIK
jgi:hypothetical protein